MIKSNDIAALSAAELVFLFKKRELSPVEVVEDALGRIERLDDKVNAFCHVNFDCALTQAKQSEERWKSDRPLGRIDGVPCTVKDLVLTSGMPTRRGSRSTRADAPSEIDAPVVASLRDEGGVILGKTTTAEFGWKGVTDNPLTGITRNPWNTLMTPGGSSGGAAVAAALNLGVLHIGTDAGGSVRIPASFTGVIGMKPTFGYVPQWPASAMGTLSHIGPMTRTVQDAAIMQSVMARGDSRDSLSAEPGGRDWAKRLERQVEGLRIAYSPTLGYATLSTDVRTRADECAALLSDMGANVELVDPGFPDPTEAFRTLWYAGAANAVDKIESSLVCELDAGLLEIAECGRKFGVIDYLRAIDVRIALAELMNKFHEQWDILLTPSVPITAFKAGQNVPDEWTSDDWLTWSPFCHPFNMTQQPAISIPFGFDAGGMPVGVQLVGPKFRDDLVFNVANALCAACPPRFLRVPQ